LNVLEFHYFNLSNSLESLIDKKGTLLNSMPSFTQIQPSDRTLWSSYVANNISGKIFCNNKLTGILQSYIPATTQRDIRCIDTEKPINSVR